MPSRDRRRQAARDLDRRPVQRAVRLRPPPPLLAFLPTDGVDTLYRVRKKDIFGFLGRGIQALAEVPAKELSVLQTIQQGALTSRRPHVDAPALRRWLRGLQYPLHLLDFETVAPAVPLLDGTRPYQAVPFQFSLHESVRPSGSLLAFNAQFEKGSCGTWHASSPPGRPSANRWCAASRTCSCHFAPFSYYHPAQHGRCSLKAALPALTGAGYERMEVADGETAGRKWLQVVHGAARPSVTASWRRCAITVARTRWRCSR